MALSSAMSPANRIEHLESGDPRLEAYKSFPVDNSHPNHIPDLSRVRAWTNRSGHAIVDAEFIAVKDGMVYLHQINGTPITVPLFQMSIGDVEYVEQLTGECSVAPWILHNEQDRMYLVFFLLELRN